MENIARFAIIPAILFDFVGRDAAVQKILSRYPVRISLRSLSHFVSKMILSR